MGTFGRKHPQSVKDKIRVGNTGKVFTPERCEAISRARKEGSVTSELLAKLHELWSYKYLNPKVIREYAGVGGTLYKRLVREVCTVPQVQFMPSDMYLEELQLVHELVQQNVWYYEIAKVLQRGPKQVLGMLKRMGYKTNTRNPNAYACTMSKLEKSVGEWLTQHNVDVRTQYLVGRFYFDFIVVNTNILIEVHGDYWHCNPKVYLGPKNDWQRYALRRDFCKRDTAKKQDYKRLVVWEFDLKQSFEAAMTQLKDKIDANREAI